MERGALDEDELAVIEPRATRRVRALARKWPIALVVLVLAGVVWSVRAPIGTRIIKRQIEAADTIEEREAALCRMDRWARSGHAEAGYRLQTRDVEGVVLQPWRDGGWDRVATLIIEWPDGSQTTVSPVDRDCLVCAFHG